MSHENDSHDMGQPADQERARQQPFCDAPATAEDLAEQQERLERLRSLADEAHKLCAREAELEVECIAADVDLKSASSKAPPKLDIRAATEIAEAFHRKRKLERALRIGEPAAARAKGSGSDHLERLHAGRAALMSWLEAPHAVRPQRVPRVVQGVLLVVAAFVVWASVVIHPTLLIVLVGLALPMAYLRLSGQDLTWLRLGAERSFRETGLKAPAAWQEPAVQTRVLEIERVMDDLSRQAEEAADAGEVDGGEVERREVEFAQAAAHLEALLAAAGQDADSIDKEGQQWLESLGNARSVRRQLEQVKIKRTEIDAEIDRGREAIFKFLSHQGEAPNKGHSDLDALAGGIQQLINRLGI